MVVTTTITATSRLVRSEARTPGTFSAGVDADYRRVVRLLPGGSTAEMADRTRVDRAVHDGETAVGYRMRVARAEGDVAEVVREVARKCEALVRKAVGAYRAAVAHPACLHRADRAAVHRALRDLEVAQAAHRAEVAHQRRVV